MNFLKPLLTVFILLIAYTTHSQSFKNASEYLDFIATEQESVTKNMWKYTKAIAHSKNDRTINAKRNVLLKTVEKAIAKIEKNKC